MFCKVCGEQIDDNSEYCSKCGSKVEQVNSIVAASECVEAHTVPADNTAPKGVQRACFIGQIAGIVGAAIFLIVVLVGLIIYGRVYLYDGYDFTKVFVTISIVLMGIGFLSILVKLIFNVIYKVNVKSVSYAKRILAMVLLVACLGFSTWGFVSCFNTNNSSSQHISFYDIYNDCNCASPWATWGVDYISIDTNPYDYDSDSSSSTKYMYVALAAIKSINTKLGLPTYLYNEMMSTRALDGRQSYSGDKVNVSWRYHPDSGLEVTYSKK